MDKLNRKYMIIGIVTILIIGIAFSIAYFTGKITGKGADIVINIGEKLQIIFDDKTEISEQNLKAGWEEEKTFTVENKTYDTFYFNIIIEDLLNELESKTLLYKITSDNGYNMSDFEPIPISLTAKDTLLISGIPIEEQTLQTYTIKLKYLKTTEIDQSDDMGKSFSGNLFITEGFITEGKKDTLAKQIVGDTSKIKKRTNFENVLPSNPSNDTESGIYLEDGLWTEDGKTVYYYAGNVTNNWVKFADIYWRIIRTNEDGGIRLLYAGSSPTATDAYVANKKAFNDYEQLSDPMDVGLKYGTSGDLSKNRTNNNNSTILGMDDGSDTTSLYGWYKTNIQDLGFDDYVSKTAIYCNDRAVDPDSVYSTSEAFDYATSNRLVDNKRPSFKCGVNNLGKVIEETQNIRDKFSASRTPSGNGELKYPVGLMTADEILFAGGNFAENTNVYYYRNAGGNSSTGETVWWTMSPLEWNDIFAYVYFVGASGRLDGNGNTGRSDVGVRPVISIKSCATIKSGNGTSNSPYEFTIDSECSSKVN